MGGDSLKPRMSQSFQIVNDLMATPLFDGVFNDAQGGNVIDGLRYLAVGFGAVLVFLGHVQRSRDATIGRFSADPARVIIITAVLTFMLFAGGRATGLAAKAGNEIPEAIGIGSTWDFIGECFGRAAAFGENPIALAEKNAREAMRNSQEVGEGESEGEGGFSLNPVRWVSAIMDWVMGSIYWVARLIFGLIAAAIIAIAVVLAAVIMFFMESLRYLALLVGAAILPLFVGALSFERTRSMGSTYITGMIGLCLWPVGWAIGNAVTLELVDVSVTTLAGGQATAVMRDALAGNLPADGADLTTLLVSTSAFSVFRWVLGVLLLLITVLWILFAAVSVPLAMVKTLTTGQEFLAQSVTNAAGSAGKVAAEVAKTAAIAA